MSIKKWIGIFIMIFAATALSAAESLKIAVVDMARIFDDYYKTRIVQSQLEEQQSVYRTHVTAMNEEYNKLQEEYKVLLDAAQNITLKEAERQEKAAEASKKLAEVKQKERDINQYLTEKSRQFKELEDTKRTEITAEILGTGQIARVVVNVNVELYLIHVCAIGCTHVVHLLLCGEEHTGRLVIGCSYGEVARAYLDIRVKVIEQGIAASYQCNGCGQSEY